MDKDTTGRGLGILLIITGLGHFLAPQALDNIVPPVLPLEPRFWTYLSGVAELSIAIMLLMPIRRKAFGISVRLLGVWCAFGLFVLVYPANIYMAIDWFDRPMPLPIVAFARLPLQFGLFYWCFVLSKKLRSKLAPDIAGENAY